MFQQVLSHPWILMDWSTRQAVSGLVSRDALRAYVRLQGSQVYVLLRTSKQPGWPRSLENELISGNPWETWARALLLPTKVTGCQNGEASDENFRLIRKRPRATKLVVTRYELARRLGLKGEARTSSGGWNYEFLMRSLQSGGWGRLVRRMRLEQGARTRKGNKGRLKKIGQKRSHVRQNELVYLNMLSSRA